MLDIDLFQQGVDHVTGRLAELLVKAHHLSMNFPSGPSVAITQYLLSLPHLSPGLFSLIHDALNCSANIFYAKS